MQLCLCRLRSGQKGQEKGGRILLYCSLLLLLCVCTGAGQPPVPPAPETPGAAFERSRMLDHLARHVMWPTYAEFASATSLLPELTAQFCAALSVEQLAALQQAWRRAVAPLQRSAAFRLGPAIGLAAAVDFWPSRPQVMQRVLGNPLPITAEFIESAGAAARGVSAIEYLLFDADGGNAAIMAQFRDGLKGERRCAYLGGLSQHLTQQAQFVANAWSPDGGNFVAELAKAGHGSVVYPTVHAAVSDVVNRFIVALEKVYKDKLGRPLHGNGRAPWPDWVEAGRSGNSLDNIVENLRGLHAVYAGHDGATDGLGFDAYLTALGSPLGKRLTQHLQTAIEAVRAIPPPLRVAVVAQPQAVEAAYQELKTLLILLKVDLTNLLGVTVDFSDNDSD